MSDLEGRKEKLGISSCTECQRRKQKCSRTWPCNHCLARKVPHLCQLRLKKFSQDSASNSNTYADLVSADAASAPLAPLTVLSDSSSRGVKRSSPDDSLDAPPHHSNETLGALEHWGYMPGHVHYNLTENPTKASSASNKQSPEVETVLNVFPPRTITDALVNHFLNHVNYKYNWSSVYGPTFTDKYVQWWKDRACGRAVSPEYTCLLIRVLAYSAQYPSASLRKMIGFELACNSETLTRRLGDAAELLSSTFATSETNLERVEELFLRAAWLKSESRIVESWHAIGATIRAAQELGMDKDVGNEDLSEFDIEIRRRIWTILYIWDWQMSAWLARPHLIDQRDCDFRFPNLRLDSNPDSNVLSPFAHMSLQGTLCRRVTKHMANTPGLGCLSTDQVIAAEAECENFIAELPVVFSLESPDLSLDEDQPHYVFQRSQLHIVIYMTRVQLYKRFLTRPTTALLSTHEEHFRAIGIDMSINLLQRAREFFAHDFTLNAKFHSVVLCVFDTATVLCSAIIHDTGKRLTRRHEIMDAIDDALHMLHELSLNTRIGASSYNFLLKLVQAIPKLSKHGPIRKRQKISTDSVSEQRSPEEVHQATAPVMLLTEPTAENPFTIDSVPQDPATDAVFDFDSFLQQNPLGDPSQLEGWEEIWDWGTLNLEHL